jgi:alcohol dehydrogenase, propanol-preferring
MQPVTAMVLDRPKTRLRHGMLTPRDPAPDEVVIAVAACGVCRTDLHVVDGELEHPKLPLVPGHEIVGHVVAAGRNVDRFKIGARVGVPWLGWTCGVCDYCRKGLENLCPRARFTGYDIDGGYAGSTIADHRYCFGLPESFTDAAAAPLLCAGLIGYRTLAMAGDPERVGIYGFGAAAHIVAQVALHQGRRLFAFTRPGDTAAQDFALKLGCHWAGGSDMAPPEELDAALIFCACRRPCAGRVARGSPRRDRGLRRHPHERYSGVPL